MLNQGFTLIEMIVGIALITVVLTLFLNLLLNSSQQIIIINHKLVSSNLARLKIEEILNQDIDNFMTTSYKKFLDPEYQNYWYRILITQSSNNLKKVIVKVKYKQKIWAKLITLKAEEN